MRPVPVVPGASRREGDLGSCPACGQPLADLRAARHLHRSELEFDRRLEAAVRARMGEVADELADRLEEEHREMLERLRSHEAADDDVLASVKARHAERQYWVRTMFRQF